MGSLHYQVTSYKITRAGHQVAQWDFQNNASRINHFDVPLPLFFFVAKKTGERYLPKTAYGIV